MEKKRKQNFKHVHNLEIVHINGGEGKFWFTGTTNGDKQIDINVKVDLYDVAILAEQIRKYMSMHETTFKNQQYRLRTALGYSNSVAEVTYKQPTT